MDIRTWPRLRLQTNETSTRNQQALQLCSNWREYEQLLPISEGILRSCRHTNHFPWEYWQNSGTPNTSLAWWHCHRRPWNERRAYPGTTFCTFHIRKQRLQGKEDKNQNSTRKKQYGSDIKISPDGVRQNKEKTDAMNKLEPPTNAKTLKSFLGAIQYLAKLISKLSEKTNNMRQLFKKGTKWDWTTDRNTDFKKK